MTEKKTPKQITAEDLQRRMTENPTAYRKMLRQIFRDQYPWKGPKP